MTNTKRVVLVVLLWTAVVTSLHLHLNFDWQAALNDRLPEDKRKLNVAYIPVT